MKTSCIMALAISVLASVECGASGWRLTVGPAWRSRVKTEVRGSLPVPSMPASTTVTGYDRNPGEGEWSAADVTERRPDPSPSASPGDELWAVGGSFTETTVTPDDGAAGIEMTGERSPMGIRAGVGCDVWQTGDLKVGLDFRFAGYWNLRSGFAGTGGGATVSTRTVTDWWLFEGGPYPDDADFGYAPNPTLDPGSREYGTPTVTRLPGRTVRGRLSADLYQLGIGPTVAWSVSSWLDAYAGVAALCNIAAIRLESDAGGRESRTGCRFGLGAEAGLAAYLTDNLGLYAEVGYEWVDRFSASVDDLTTRVDFSSLTVGAGIVVRF